MTSTGDVAVEMPSAGAEDSLVGRGGSNSAPAKKQSSCGGAPVWAVVTTGVLTVITGIMVVLFLVELSMRDRLIHDGACMRRLHTATVAPGTPLRALPPPTDVILTTSPDSPRGYTNAGFLAAGSGEWVAKAHLPYAVSDLAVVEYNGVGLLLGGLSDNGTVLDTVALYDPTFETINTTFTTLPTPRYRFGAAIAGDKLFVVGGYAMPDGDPLATCDEFTFATHSWAPCPNMSLPRGDIAAAAGVAPSGDPAVYVFGGYSIGYDASVSGTLVEALLVGGSSWRTRAAMPTARGDLGAITLVSHNGIFGVGGWSPVTEKFTAAVEVYLPAADRWVALPAMPTARGDKALAILGHHLLVMGGEVWSGKTGPCPWDPSLTCDVNEVPLHAVHSITVEGHGVHGVEDVKEFSTAHWTTHAPVPDARFRFAAAALGEAVFTFGGHAQKTVSLPTVDAFYDVEHPEVWVHVKGPGHDHHDDEDEDEDEEHDHDRAR